MLKMNQFNMLLLKEFHTEGNQDKILFKIKIFIIILKI